MVRGTDGMIRETGGVSGTQLMQGTSNYQLFASVRAFEE